MSYSRKKPVQSDCTWSEWRYSHMEDEDFETLALCRKCHEPLHNPKTLPCLHTICLRCLQIHYRLDRKQVQFVRKENPEQYNFMGWNGCFTCPLCAFPCYAISGNLSNFPTNRRLLALSFMERIMRIKQLKKDKAKETAATKKSSKSSKGKKGSATSEHRPLLSQPELADQQKTAAPGASPEHRAPGGAGPEPQAGINILQTQVVSHFDGSSPVKSKMVTLEEALTKHSEYVRRECRALPEDFLGDLEIVWPDETKEPPSLTDYGYLHPREQYGLTWGDAAMEIHAPSAIAINPATGHVVVVDSMLNKALLFRKNLSKPWAYKQFHRPIMDVSFYPPGFMDAARDNGYDEMGLGLPTNYQHHPEIFCAMGRNLKRQGVIIYRVPFTREPYEYSDHLQEGVRDVSGLLLLPEGRMLISLGYDNTILIQIVNRTHVPADRDNWTPKLMDLAARRTHGLFNPTHLIKGGPGQVIVSDTNNHRIGVFYGPDYMASDFYCDFGHGKGELFYPLGLAMDSERHLFICDAGNHRIQVLDHCFAWHGFPIRATYRMGTSVLQDVKPIDCSMDGRDRLLVLFKGRGFVSLQLFNYQGPLISTGEDVGFPDPLYEDATCDCSCFSFFKCCRRSSIKQPDLQYGSIQ